jgi:hypothetical protein
MSVAAITKAREALMGLGPTQIAALTPIDRAVMAVLLLAMADGQEKRNMVRAAQLAERAFPEFFR